MTGLFSQYGSTASMVWLVAGVIVGALVLFFIYDAIAAAVEKLRSAARREPDFDRDRRGVAPASSLGAKISPDSNRPWSRQSPLAARFLRRVVPERRTWSEHRLNQPFDE